MMWTMGPVVTGAAKERILGLINRGDGSRC